MFLLLFSWPSVAILQISLLVRGGPCHAFFCISPVSVLPDILIVSEPSSLSSHTDCSLGPLTATIVVDLQGMEACHTLNSVGMLSWIYLSSTSLPMTDHASVVPIAFKPLAFLVPLISLFSGPPLCVSLPLAPYCVSLLVPLLPTVGSVSYQDPAYQGKCSQLCPLTQAYPLPGLLLLKRTTSSLYVAGYLPRWLRYLLSPGVSWLGGT